MNQQGQAHQINAYSTLLNGQAGLVIRFRAKNDELFIESDLIDFRSLH